MDTAFTSQVRVRAYECDSFGHVNNAVYLQYLHQVTLDALGIPVFGDAYWRVRTASLEYHGAARYGDTLTVAAWIVASGELSVDYGYRINRTADGAAVVYAKIAWNYCDWATHEPRSLPDLPRLEHLPAPLKPFAPAQNIEARPFRWRHQVRRYELDASGHVAPAVCFNWLEEITYRAAAITGWPLERLRAENVLTLQRRHDAEFFEGASNGDEIEVVSRLIEMRRVRGTWLHEIYRLPTMTLLMRDYSTGVFVDWQGNIRAAPQEMVEAVLLGEPVSE
jgi:YbgC/YbaW family acyl-CoA thioester hydrolase